MARPFASLPRWVSVALLVALLTWAVAGVVLVLLGSLKPQLADSVRGFDLWGLALFALAVVPLHELAHGVACRVAGAPVQGAGLILHGNILPGPYVDTTQAYRVSARWSRFWIPAWGPLVDLLAAGAAAWVVLHTAGLGAVGHASRYVFLLSLAFLYFDTNPLTNSDGSRMLEAALDDELARRAALTRYRARLSPWYVIVWYRLACVLHLAGATALLSWLAP
jgi:putative peptide zinc metalloprotease protein